ncbi:aldehyde dehydrogenase family protein [Tropicimonas sp. IMCC6043]|uniref:aldehyde dehydrogenase family protein n=1 Tax=Tropicimonas sp. IMCC6043 TaxID=2510645 RepID=UPI00101CC5A1|nr:aldehyde dehydrogenase family protein [Tropicimonas sp. IMCC6043]RYH09065.1 aldehyde dehydrogenase family protein [Tropicimonas sp. IMCC6043]
MIEKRQFFIGGAWVDPATPRDFPVIDPSTEEEVAVISLGSQADTDAAVAAANAAFPAWSETAPAERIALVERILEVYNARAEEMAQAMTLEMGAPLDLSRKSQVNSGRSHIKGFLEAAKGFEFIRPLNDHSPNDRILYDPIGTVAMITPWNWPMNQVSLKVIPALLAGCTMVLKPSEIAPLSSILWSEILEEAGVPAGVYNMVNGDGPGVGNQLSSHPGIDMVSFTGSTRAGIAISKAAADTIKRVSLELGGKGANLIFADSDADAVRRGVKDMMQNTGQSCNAPSRMLVERRIYDEAVEIAREAAEATAVANAHEEGPHIGPLVSQAQWDKVQGLIETGIAEGARLVAGGPGRPEGLNRGYFARPTVFADVTSDMTIAREEIFGPVLSMMPFDTEEEAVRIANDTVYGLTNYAQTQDPDRLRRLARSLQSGMVEFNGEDRSRGAPFGGIKQSGNGREGGLFGLEDFLEVKAVGGYPAA